MLSRFFPDIYIDSVKELPVESLKAMNIKLLIFDIDNTLAPFDEDSPGQETVDFIGLLKREGFMCCLVSNNSRGRVDKFNEKLKAKTIYRAGKPGIKRIRAFLDETGVPANEAAIIGDQVFTDVFCGKRLKMYSVLTKPMCKRDQFVTWIKRGAESLVVKEYLKRGGKNAGI
ncbi:MAG: YqeG family HAD IIIA-type phosphatase [Lachnospiraceae bacterium]|nr:YqeG family HAD IIIA-type phosphatase [Lachnospiraceae bacterium]